MLRRVKQFDCYYIMNFQLNLERKIGKKNTFLLFRTKIIFKIKK